MKFRGQSRGAADRRLLPEGRMTGPMPWVIGIMMFLTSLAAAAGLALGGAATRLSGGDRVTIQIMEANPEHRREETQAALNSLEGMTGVDSIKRVPPEEMRRLLEPWLGAGGMEADLPIPDMIDVELTSAEPDRVEQVRARLRQAAPSVRIDEHATSLAPLGKLVMALRLLAASLALMTIGATAATIVLAARAALDTHRGTIDILHLMGATDAQIARLFQRRIALDALLGGLAGFAAALLVLWLIGERIGAVGSELLGSTGLQPANWIILALLPIGGVLLAMAVARWTIMRAMKTLS